MPRLDAAAPRRKRRWLVLPLALLALPIALKMFGIQPTNRASTSLDSADASLRTRFYATAPPDVHAQVLMAVPELSTYGQRWRVKSEVFGEGVGPEEVRCEVPVIVFTDDVTITIAPHKGGSLVDVASASRVGQGDFGENARHIRQILSALDERLGPSRG